MYCKHCNFKLEGELASAKFCPVCGASLDSNLGDNSDDQNKKDVLVRQVNVLEQIED